MNDVADTILQQLGGGRFKVMTGARNFVYGDDYLLFMIGGGAKDRINTVKITLTPADDYTLEFFRSRGLNYVPVAKAEGVYVENLRNTFTDHTGFYCTMGQR